MPKPSKTINKHEAIIIDHLSASYGAQKVLDDISVTIPRGHIAAIIGPNGSGKTTLLKAILDLIPSEGHVTFFGKHLAYSREKIGYVPQKFQFTANLPLTVNDFLDLTRHKKTTEQDIHRALHDVGLHAHIGSTSLSSLSGGQLQRVLIAQAIMNKPEILFLDEPSNNIDIAGEATFYDIIKHLNKEHDTTVVMVSHDISTIAPLVDTIICINGALLCSGAPREVLNEKTLHKLFGSSALYEHPHQHS